ncbi:hypothetical protein D3C75_1268620 [compost metagenome]
MGTAAIGKKGMDIVVTMAGIRDMGSSPLMTGMSPGTAASLPPQQQRRVSCRSLELHRLRGNRQALHRRADRNDIYAVRNP